MHIPTPGWHGPRGLGSGCGEEEEEEGEEAQ